MSTPQSGSRVFHTRTIRAEELTMPAGVERLPRIVEPRGSRGFENLLALLEENKGEVEERLRTVGAVLFRGWKVGGAENFERVLETLGYKLEPRYLMGTTPRQSLGQHVFSSTEAPPEFPIFAHNEMSYLNTRPLAIAFYCSVQPERFGETPIFDTRKALRDLDPEVRGRLERLKVRYVRKLPHRRRFYQSSIQRTWSEAFQTTSRSDVDEIARTSGVSLRWKGDDLQSEVMVDPIVRHPETGEMSLNIQLYHKANVMLDIANLASRQSVVTNQMVRLWARIMFRAGLFPMQIRYGDGSPIPDADIEAIRRATWDNAVLFAWKLDDILLLDNLVTAHGRMNVTGPRKIYAAFGRMISFRPPDPSAWPAPKAS